MKYDTIYQVRAQLNGCYMPDSCALFSSYRAANAYARELAYEWGTVYREQWSEDTVAYFVRDEHQTWSAKHDSYPYHYIVEPVSWREIAGHIGVQTRTEVLEAQIDNY